MPPPNSLTSERNFKEGCRLAVEENSNNNKKQLIVCSFEEEGWSPTFYLYEGSFPPKRITKITSKDNSQVQIEFESLSDSKTFTLKTQNTSNWSNLAGTELGNWEFANGSARENSQWKITYKNRDLTNEEITLNAWEAN